MSGLAVSSEGFDKHLATVAISTGVQLVPVRVHVLACSTLCAFAQPMVLKLMVADIVRLPRAVAKLTELMIDLLITMGFQCRFP